MGFVNLCSMVKIGKDRGAISGASGGGRSGELRARFSRKAFLDKHLRLCRGPVPKFKAACVADDVVNTTCRGRLRRMPEKMELRVRRMAVRAAAFGSMGKSGAP